MKLRYHTALRRTATFVAVLLCCMAAHAQINTDQVLKIGRNALYFEDYVLSIQYFNQVVDAKPYLAEPYFYRAVAKLSLDDFKGAEQDATLCIERNPFIVDAYQVRGVARQNTGRFDLAIEDYDEGLRLMPEDKILLYNKAMCHTELKQFDEAGEAFDRLLRLDRKSDRAYLGLARLNLLKADTVQAIEHLDRSLELNKNNVTAFAMRSEVEMRQEDFARAQADMDEAIKLDPQFAGYFVNRAFMKYKQDDYYGAMADYDYALSIAPDDMAAHYNRAMLSAEVGDLQRAITDFTWVLDHEPDNTLARYNRAMLYVNSGRYREAVADYDRVLDKYPKFEAGYMARSDARRRMGDARGSERDLNTAVNIMKRKGTHKSDYNPVLDEAGKARQKSDDEFVAEAESEDEIMSRFNDLVTVETTQESKPEYANRSRGHIQNTNFDIKPEGMFVLSYYNNDNKLNGKTHFMNEMLEVNELRQLPASLVLVSGDTRMGEEAIGQRFASINYYDGLLATAAPRPIDYLGRAVDYLLVKNPQATIADATRAIEMAPDFALAYFLRANAEVLRYEMTVSQHDDVPTQDAIAQAEATLREREAGEALKCALDDIGQVLKFSPRNVYAHYNRGYVYLLMNDYTSAISAFTRAIELKPDLGEAYYNRGLMYLRMGNKELGMSDLSKAGELGVLPSYNVLKRMNRR